MADQNSLHVALAHQLQLNAQPLHVPETRLRGIFTAIDAGVAVEEVHRVEAEDGKMVRDSLDVEPATKLERVTLRFGDEAAPDITVGVQPLIGAGIEDVVREEIIVAKGRDDGDVKFAMFASDSVHEFVGEDAVGAEDGTAITGVLLVAVVTGRVARPDDKVDIVLDVGLDPIEGGVDEGEGGVAVGLLCAVRSGMASLAVAGDALLRRRMRFVELVGMQI